MDQLDAVYRTQRLRLHNTVAAGAARLWANGYQDEGRTVDATLSLVQAGQARTVALVDGYMTAKTRAAVGKGDVKLLNPASYTVEALRGAPAQEVYERPYGALRTHLAENGADGWGAGMQSATSTLARLTRTDLQLAQTHAARDWMAEDKYVRGYERVLGAGKNCELCEAAASSFYYREDLAPIHDNCGCSVAPVYGEPGPLTRALHFHTDDCRVSHDSEIGPRLLAPDWTG